MILLLQIAMSFAWQADADMGNILLKTVAI
jgi:hypothetical protein